MKRKIITDLLKWKNSKSNMPFMLIGARQVGKTYILDEFCRTNFENYLYINLEKESEIQAVFENTLDPKEIIESISILKEIKISLSNTVIFWDEIQVSERAITSLKYFNESEKDYNIVCAGSLLGVALNRFRHSYPVGKVRKVTLHPMDFEEFLWSINQKKLADMIKEHFDKDKQMLEPVHKKALLIYRDYLYVGGMPASILEYIEKEYSLANYDNTVKRNIIEAYSYDMSKYTTTSENMKINKLYNSIPKQLNRENTKFTYKIIDDKANKRNYETSIEWLINSNLVSRCVLVETPCIPLSVYEKESIFKIYLNDVGLLCELANIKPKDLLSNEFNLYRGMLCENFVAQSFISNGLSLNYWKSKKDAEIDFILNISGSVIPIEVKSSTNTKAKSLKMYIEKYKPTFSIKISAKNFGYVNNIKSIPLYAVYLLRD